MDRDFIYLDVELLSESKDSFYCVEHLHRELSASFSFYVILGILHCKTVSLEKKLMFN